MPVMLEKNRLDPRKDSCVRANTQGQSDHDRDSEARPLQEHSTTVPQVLPEGFHRLDNNHRVKRHEPIC